MIAFATYWPLLCLPLPWLVAHFCPPAKAVQNAALFVPFYSRFTQLLAAPAKSIGFSQFKWLPICIWLLLLLAAMGPQWVGPPQAVFTSGRNIMLAVDISGSMQTPDMKVDQQPVDRLTMVKRLATDFIKKRQGDRLGLIVFGSKAYLQAPLTFDLQTVQEMLQDATIGLAGPNTALGDAIGLGVLRMAQIPTKHRVLILLTDGASNAGGVSPEAAIVLAKKERVTVYTIGVGSTRMMVPGLLGPQFINPSSELDEPGLQQIAKQTGGKYFRAVDAEALAAIYNEINQLEPTVNKGALVRATVDYYYVPLLLALILSLGLAIRRIIAIRAMNLKLESES